MQAVRNETMRCALDIGDIARRHYAIVYRFCARRVGIEAASDAAQDTFLTAQRALPKFRGDSNLSTWLLGIAHNECRRIARRRKLDPPVIEFEPPAQGSPEAAMIDRHWLEGALSRLSPDHRDVVLLHEVEGLSYDEAAEVLGVPTGTVKSRLHHAFQNLRRTLNESLADGGVK